ncbi:MAG: hypothetical protein ACTSY1_08650 [Alphaproteobacteria bacterium]
MRKKPPTYTQRFLVEHPNCCFCGGLTPATTRDHVPAKTFFDGKHRPKGLEVPACKQCQEYSKKHELVASMIARIFPDASTPTQKREIPKIMRRANKAVPGLLEELRPSPRQQSMMPEIQKREPNAAGVLNVSGPLVNTSLDIVGIKMTIALHYEKTRIIVPKDGAISIRIYSNYDALDGKIPKKLMKILGPEDTLQQGKWSVSNQFSYAYAISDTKQNAIYFSTFRYSFAVLGIVWGSVNLLLKDEGMKTFIPQENGKYRRIS